MGNLCGECQFDEISKFAIQKQLQSTNLQIKDLNLDIFIQREQNDYRIVGNWESNTEKQKVNGIGIIYQPGIFYYEGEIVKGEATGKGIIKWEGMIEDSYEGQFKNNKPQGKGTYYNKELKLQGEWKNGEPKKGYLKINEESHTIINIDLKKIDDYTSGKVQISMSDGTYYNGQIQHVNGIFFYNGRGTIIFRDGNKYSGEWSNGKIHGRGVYEWVKDKVKYDGEYKFGVKDGVGRYYLTSKKYMKGRWIKGKKEGNFQVIQEDGGNQIQLGVYQFENDELKEKNFVSDISEKEQ